MKSIWKFGIPPGIYYSNSGHFGLRSASIEMPKGSQVLCVQVQRGLPKLWAIVDTEASPEFRTFKMITTGTKLPGGLGSYIGTFQLDDKAQSIHVFDG